MDADLYDYPPNWREISRATRRAAGGRCERCGAPEKAGHSLHVHHFNANKSDCTPENLAVLCLTCHTYIEAYWYLPWPGENPEPWLMKRGILSNDGRREPGQGMTGPDVTLEDPDLAEGGLDHDGVGALEDAVALDLDDAL